MPRHFLVQLEASICKLFNAFLLLFLMKLKRKEIWSLYKWKLTFSGVPCFCCKVCFRSAGSRSIKGTEVSGVSIKFSNIANLNFHYNLTIFKFPAVFLLLLRFQNYRSHQILALRLDLFVFCAS